MYPFVFRVKHNPCLMPSQSHCSHTVTLHPSACPLAVGSVVSSQALSCYCGVPPTGPAAVGNCRNTDCSIISSLEHQETGMRIKHKAFQAFWHYITAMGKHWIWLILSTVEHLIGQVKRKKQKLNGRKHLIFFLFSTNTDLKDATNPCTFKHRAYCFR